jgi:hypothetical protein
VDGDVCVCEDCVCEDDIMNADDAFEAFIIYILRFSRNFYSKKDVSFCANAIYQFAISLQMQM